MRDSVSRVLIAFVALQCLFVALLPFVLIPPPESFAYDVYIFGFRTARDLVIEAAAGSIVLFTIAVWIQRNFYLDGFLAAAPLMGVAMVLAPFFYHTQGVTASGTGDKGLLFFVGYVLLALVLGALYWFLAIMERRD